MPTRWVGINFNGQTLEVFWRLFSTNGMNENGMGMSTGQASHSGIKGNESSRRNRGSRSETGKSEKVMELRDHWANQLCTPEWMLTVPSDLNGAGSPVGAGEDITKFLLVMDEVGEIKPAIAICAS